jgi:glycosyltransferase involved in cell wall biosynthesis
MVSVVIPCYRQAHFLPEAIESVLAQTYGHVEIIVVDDGSPDDTSAVAARYSKVRCVRQGNQGLPAARNAGVRESVGPYLVFLDADDRLRPDALAIGVRHLAAHAECALVAGDQVLIDEQGSITPSWHPPRPTRDHYLELLANNFIWCPADVMYRRSTFEVVGVFDTALTSAEDYALYLRVARQLPIWAHDEIVAEYRWYGSGMSRNPQRMLKSTIDVLRAERRHLKGNRLYEEACGRGIGFYQRLYGDPLIAEIGMHLHGRLWRRAVSASRVALQYDSRALARRAYRRLRRTITEALV